MRQAYGSDSRERTEISAREARQARYGKPALYVLIGVLAGTVIGIAIAGFVIG